MSVKCIKKIIFFNFITLPYPVFQFFTKKCTIRCPKMLHFLKACYIGFPNEHGGLEGFV